MKLYHERLQVYHKAVDAFVLADELSLMLPPRWNALADQLRRAALSIGANIAEGALEYADGEQKRFYRIAKRSAGECAFFTTIMLKRNYGDPSTLAQLDHLLYEIVCMLTAMIKRSP